MADRYQDRPFPADDDHDRRDGQHAPARAESDPLAELARLIGHRFQNPCDGMRNARLKREDEFSHAMIIVSSAMVSSS